MIRRPRLLHVTTTAVSLDWLLAPQLVAFKKAGFDVSTVSAGGSHVASLEAKGISHVAAPSLSRNMEPMRDFAAASELRSLFSQLQPDIVHTHNPKPGVLGRVIGQACKVPIVVNTVHGLYAQPTDRLVRRAAVYGLERLAATCSDAELVQNPEDVATLRRLGVPSERLHLLGNGIDLDRFAPSHLADTTREAVRREFGIPSDMPVIAMVGRLVWEKGYREFFEAIIELQERATQRFEVVVIGPSEPGKVAAVDHGTIERMKRRGVRFLGSRTDVDRLLRMVDVFALPSHREGFPRAAMEASAMGIPVVATDIRGCRQVVVHGQTGLLVTPGDSGELADALSGLLDDPALRATFGAAAARRAASEFDQARVISRTLAIYRSLLRDAGLPLPQGRMSQPQGRMSRYSASIDLVAFEASKRAAEVRASSAIR